VPSDKKKKTQQQQRRQQQQQNTPGSLTPLSWEQRLRLVERQMKEVQRNQVAMQKVQLLQQRISFTTTPAVAAEGDDECEYSLEGGGGRKGGFSGNHEVTISITPDNGVEMKVWHAGGEEPITLNLTPSLEPETFGIDGAPPAQPHQTQATGAGDNGKHLVNTHNGEMPRPGGPLPSSAP
jgi:hypothetical protein